MANFNKVILAGNLTRDVELRYTQGGTAVGKFGMAVNRTYSVNGERKESTCFVDCTAWGRQAETLDKYMSKGRPLLIEGRLEYSTWEGQDGGKRSKLEVVVENFQVLGGSRSEDGGGGGGGGGGRSRKQSGGGGNAGGGEEMDYGEIPF